MRKAVASLTFGSVSEYSRVTAPSSKDITRATTPRGSGTLSIQKGRHEENTKSSLGSSALSKLSFLQTAK